MKVFLSSFSRSVKAVLKHTQSRRSATNARPANGAKRLDCGGSPPLFFKCRPAPWLAVLTTILFSPFAASAETTNTLSDVEIQGRAFVEKILEQRPAENFTNCGLLNYRAGNDKHSEYPIRCETIVTPTNWSNSYQLFDPTNSANPIRTLTVLHDGSNSNQYRLHLDFGDNRDWTKDGQTVLRLLPFAGDFGCADLGLEFFHWPQQKILKKEFHRQCACMVLESTNPNPTTYGYSRVVSWIDEESLGIVEAFAYDANGKKLKNFYPKNFEKVNGQYQVQSMIMENLQTGSKTRLEFDLKK